MKVRMLQTVEDANELELGDPLAARQEFSVGHRKHPRYITRVDKLRQGTEPDLPQSQADNLISMGYAEAV